jgi:hypothetical protein
MKTVEPDDDYLNPNCPLPHFQRGQLHITVGIPTRLDRYSVNLEHNTNYLQNSQHIRHTSMLYNGKNNAKLFRTVNDDKY